MSLPDLASLLNLTRPLVWFDLETTGKYAESARIVQIAIEVYEPGQPPKAWKTLVNPERPIPAEATEKHGVTDAMVANAPTFKALAPRLHPGFAAADLAGYNVKMYDAKVLALEFKRAGLDWSAADRSIVDVFRLWQILEPRTLEDAVEKWLARKATAAHDAAGDTADARDVFLSMFSQFGARLPADVAKLHDLCWPADPDAVVNDADGRAQIKFVDGEATLMFGKAKGKPLHLVDRGYMEWMLKQDFSPKFKTVIREAMQGRYPVRPA